jgi:hypothetical protein
LFNWKWNIDLTSPEAKEIFNSIDSEGVKVFRQQPGFIQYHLMLADAHTTVAVAEWASEELGKKGAENYRNWLRSSGIWNKLVLQTTTAKSQQPPHKPTLCSSLNKGLDCSEPLARTQSTNSLIYI